MNDLEEIFSKSDEMIAKLTDENIEDIGKALEDIRTSSTDLSAISNLPSNNGCEDNANPEQGYSKMMNVAIDPNTGEHQLLGEDVTEESRDFTEAIDDIDSDDITFEEDNSPITESEINNYIKNGSADGIFGDLAADQDLPPEDIIKLLEIANRRKNNEKFNVFRELPDSVKTMVLNYLGLSILNNSQQAKTMRNSVAEVIIDEFITNISVERSKESINKEIEDIFKSSSAEIGDSIVGYTEERNTKYREYANHIEDEDKKNRMINILNIIDEASNLTNLKEFCKKCKIKSIDLDTKKSKSRTIDDFLFKYDNNANYNIYNLYNAEKVLARRLNPGDEVEYSEVDIRAFMVAFCTYCKNYNPNVPEEHAFMYYTIYNIVISDVNIGDKKEVSDKFLNNVKDCIKNLRIRNNNFA